MHMLSLDDAMSMSSACSVAPSPIKAMDRECTFYHILAHELKIGEEK